MTKQEFLTGTFVLVVIFTISGITEHFFPTKHVESTPDVQIVTPNTKLLKDRDCPEVYETVVGENTSHPTVLKQYECK